MLPDFPETKRLFSRFFQTYMRRKMREVSPFGMLHTRYLHEGRTMKITRADDTKSESGMVQMSSMLEIKVDEIEGLTFEKVIEKHDALVADMAVKQAHFIRERMSAELPESQTLDGKGKKFDAQMLIDVLDKMQIEFYPDGTPHEIYGDGSMFRPERMAAIEKELDESPELKRKFDDMMVKKKEAWLAREADRKLVD
jgi:hypothetical protein